MCYITRQSDDSLLAVSRALIVHQDLSWNICIHGDRVQPSCCSALSSFPSILTYDAFKQLVSALVECNICCGHPDPEFVNMAKVRKGKFLSINKKVIARLDSYWVCCVAKGSDCSLYNLPCTV